MEPLLSVIIPLYNTESYVEKCIDSIEGQSFKDIEIIVVNDSSTDGSSEIIGSYCSRFNNIKLLNLPFNTGAGNARNVGLNVAKGKYVSFVDSDDWIDSNMYKIMIASLEQNSCDIAVCGVKNEFNNISSSRFRYDYVHENIINSSLALKLMCRSLSSDISISSIACNKIFSRNLIVNNRISFLADSYFEDNIFTFFSFIFAKSIVLVPNVYYHYYQRSNSTTHSFTKKHVNDLIRSFTEIRKNLVNHKLFDKYKNEYLSFFEKCITSALSILFASEKNSTIQKKYVKFLLSTLVSNFSDVDIIEYVDIQRIKRFFDV